MANRAHPKEILLGAQAASGVLPVCDHYCGVEARIVKSLALQAQMAQDHGACLFDVTLDCEDGAPVGAEAAHAVMVVDLLTQAHRPSSGAVKVPLRTATRVHPVDHPAFVQDVQTIVGRAGQFLSHIMIPKVESTVDIELAVKTVDAAAMAAGISGRIPLHALIESPAAVHNAFAIAAHPRVQSLSFGLMDYVSAHAGALPASAMAATSKDGQLGQFEHPMVVRAKLEIAAACHAAGKVPAHSVITEFSDTLAMQTAARRAAREFGFTRMWSIHPSQIQPILDALAPTESELDEAANIVKQADAANWAPISFAGQLHDRASYRYFWQVLEQGRRTGRKLPASANHYFS